MKLKTIFGLCVFIILFLCCKTPATEPHNRTAYDARVDSLFRQAAGSQKSRDFPAAIHFYKELLSLTPPSTETGDTTVSLVKEALIQLMYCHFFTGQRGSAAAYYQTLYADTTSWIVQTYPRNVEICLGYSLYEAGRLPEAVALIERALSRSDKGIPADELYADYGIAGAIYNQMGNLPEAIRCTEKCAAILRTLEDKTDLINALCNLIYQYQQVGNFDRSLAAYEELIALKEVKENAYQRCIAEVNIISMFDEWGLDEEVRKHLETARQAAEASGIPEARLRVKNLETAWLLERGETQAATLAVDTLAGLLPTDTTESFYRIYYQDFRLITDLLNAPAGDPDITARALDRMQELQAAPLDRIRCDICYFIGWTLAQKGLPAKAILAYETCVPYICENRLLNFQRKVYHALARLYTEKKEYATATRYYTRYDTVNLAFTKRRNAALMSQFRIKYETREKEQANELLRTEVDLQKRTIQYYTVTGIAIALLLILLLTRIVMRHRALRLQHMADTRQHELDLLRQEEAERVIRTQETELRRMLQERLEMNRKNEELLTELEKSHTEEQFHRLMESLVPRLLTPNEEQQFRQQFALVYPTFLPRLRQDYPTVSRSEELLVMFIRLHLTNEEIALTLGIHRNSVNTARSRLRKKLGLPTHESLEEFIQKL